MKHHKVRRGTPRSSEPHPRCNVNGKYKYASESKARKVARRQHTPGRKLRCYLCPACGAWHLTKQVKRGAE